MARLSIIVVPSRNTGDYLLHAVQSVLSSNVQDLECFVVYAENHRQSVASLPTDDPRLMIHRQASDGPVQSINQVLAKATGDVIGLLNSDDLYQAEALGKVVRHFELEDTCDALYGQVDLVNAEERFIRRLKIYTPTLSLLRERPCLYSSAFFFRRRLIERLGEFDESLKHWMHYDFWIRIALGRVAFATTKSTLATKRIYPSSQLTKPEICMEEALEAIRLTKTKFGTNSIRWALVYGRSSAAKAGHNRLQTSAFDYVTLRSAITDVAPFVETRFARWTRTWRIVKQHCMSEINKIRRRPRYGLRFLPRSIGARIRKSFGRRVFQLRYDEPHACQLPASYFSQEIFFDAPTISIVTPNLNQGTYIERTLRSVLDQNYPRLEYVVQDGCSSDNSLEVIHRYAPRLDSWESIPDKGQSQAINRGLARTNGEIMAYLNSDDTLVPGSLACVAKYFEDHPSVDVVYGNRLLIDERDRIINRWILPAHDRETLRWADYIPQETMFWRRRAWDAVGAKIDESFQFAMDWDLILRFQAAGMVFHRIPRFLGAFRISDSQKTSQLLATSGLSEMNRLRKRELGFCPTDREVSRHVRPYIRRQRYNEKLHELSEWIAQTFSPFPEWKMDDASQAFSAIESRSAA